MRGARRLNVHVSPRSPWPFATLVFAFFLLSAASNLPTFISFLNRPVYYAEDNGGRLDAFSSFECSFLWHLNSLLFYIAWEAAFRWSRSLTKAAIFSRGDSARREALLANCARRPGDTRGCNGGRFFIFFQLNLISYPHQCWPVRTLYWMQNTGLRLAKLFHPGSGERKVSNRAIVEKYDVGGVRRRFRNRALKFPKKKST